MKLETCKITDFSTQGYLLILFSIYSLIACTTDAINDYQNNPLNCNVTIPNYETLCTAGIFATYPQSFLTLGTGFFDQVSGSSFWYINDLSNHKSIEQDPSSIALKLVDNYIHVPELLPGLP